jgi:hypothetical protein
MKKEIEDICNQPIYLRWRQLKNKECLSIIVKGDSLEHVEIKQHYGGYFWQCSAFILDSEGIQMDKHRWIGLSFSNGSLGNQLLALSPETRKDILSQPYFFMQFTKASNSAIKDFTLRKLTEEEKKFIKDDMQSEKNDSQVQAK